MQFAVVEKDQVIAEDLKQILQVSFGDAQVSFFPSLADLEAGRQMISPHVLLASARLEELRSSPVVKDIAASGAAVVVFDDWEQSSDGSTADWKIVPTPFNEAALVDAVRSALGGQVAA